MHEGYEKLDALLAAERMSMGTGHARGSMSLDGFVAYADNDPGAAVRLVRGGRRRGRQRGRPPAVPPHARERRLLDEDGRRSSAASSSVACSSTSRTAGRASIRWACPFVVVTHEPPTDWAHGRTGNAHFVTDGIEDAIAAAQEIAGDKHVGVAAGTIAAQALRAGLLDEVAIDLVPVVLGERAPVLRRHRPGRDPARRPERRDPRAPRDAHAVPGA